MSEDDDAIRLRAYRLWEQEGRPEGRHDEHWKRARAELGASQTGVRGVDAAALKGRASRPSMPAGRARTKQAS